MTTFVFAFLPSIYAMHLYCGGICTIYIVEMECVLDSTEWIQMLMYTLFDVIE